MKKENWTKIDNYFLYGCLGFIFIIVGSIAFALAVKLIMFIIGL